MHLDKVPGDEPLGLPKKQEMVPNLAKILRILKKVFPQSTLDERGLADHVKRANDEFFIDNGGYVVGKTELNREHRNTGLGRSELRDQFDEDQYGAIEESIDQRGRGLGAGAIPRAPHKNFDDYVEKTTPEEKPIELSLAYAITMLGWGRNRPEMRGVEELYVEDAVSDTKYTISWRGISVDSLSDPNHDEEEHLVVKFEE